MRKEGIMIRIYLNLNELVVEHRVQKISSFTDLLKSLHSFGL